MTQPHRGIDGTGRAHGAIAGRPVASRAIAVNLLGVLAFVWPFVLPLAPGRRENHRRRAR